VRILVTGAAGFIGSHLCEQLLAEGHEVVGIDSFVDYYPRALKEANLRSIGEHPRFAFAELDLRTSPLEEVLEGIDAVINEAAMAGLVRSWTDLETYVGCNILGLQRLITAASAAGVTRFVQASTSSVYGRDAVGDESQPTRPVSPYGVTKLAAEHLLLAHVVATGFPAIILRYFSVYGPRQRPDMAYQTFIDATLRGRSITVYGDGSQSRANTYVADCVRGTIDAIDGAEVGEVYNIGGGEELALRRAIELIADAAGASPTIHVEPARPGDQVRTWADTEKARRAFGYRPTVAAATGIRAQVEWQTEVLARARQGEVRPPSAEPPTQR
jgi:nucleoside-diphosphate-sugar epimerase